MCEAMKGFNIESELLDYKESKKSLPNEATKIIDSIREELKDNIDEWSFFT